MKLPVSKLTTTFRAVYQDTSNYFGGAVKELKLVTWPTRSDLIRYTIITLVTIGVSVTVITGIDYGLQLLSQRFLIR